MVEVRGALFAAYLDSGHAQNRLSDAVYCHRSGEKWISSACNMSLLAAMSPVLRDWASNTAQEREEAVVISEWGEELLHLLYTGEVAVQSREQAAMAWQGLSSVGIQASLTLTGGGEEVAEAVSSLSVGGGLPWEEPRAAATPPPWKSSSNTAYCAPKVGAVQSGFSCSQCGQQCCSQGSLASHVADLHQVITCGKCDARVSGTRGLVQHTLAAHPPPSQVVPAGSRERLQSCCWCPLCHQTLGNRQALRYHLYKHAGLRPFCCTFCNTCFRTPSTLAAHVQVQHGDALVAEPGSTTAAAEGDSSMGSSRGRYVCKECGIRASTSGKLRIHLRTHTQERPFQCAVCAARFRQRSVLKVHEFMHTKESVHRCGGCNSCFATKSLLVRHTNRRSSCISSPRPAGEKLGSRGGLSN